MSYDATCALCRTLGTACASGGHGGINVTGELTRRGALRGVIPLADGAFWDVFTTRMADTMTPLEARSAAEVKLEAFLERCDDTETALLYHVLRCAGWSTDRATLTLKKAQWAL